MKLLVWECSANAGLHVFFVPADEGESFNPLKIDVFLQTLLNLAAKSFSHSFSALGK